MIEYYLAVKLIKKHVHIHKHRHINDRERERQETIRRQRRSIIGL